MQYYTAEQLSKMFNRSRDTIRRKICAGEFGETLNDGKEHMVSETGLQSYIKQHTGPAHYERHFATHCQCKRRSPPLRPKFEDIKSA